MLRVTYRKLFQRLKDMGYNKQYLRDSKIVTSNTINRMTKDLPVHVSTIVKMCNLLDCQPGDIIECVEDA